MRCIDEWDWQKIQENAFALEGKWPKSIQLYRTPLKDQVLKQSDLI